MRTLEEHHRRQFEGCVCACEGEDGDAMPRMRTLPRRRSWPCEGLWRAFTRTLGRPAGGASTTLRIYRPAGIDNPERENRSSSSNNTEARGVAIVPGARMATASPPSSSDTSPGLPNYFRRTKPHWMVLIVTGMVYYGWVVFAPTTILYDWLGPLGCFTKYLVENHNLLLKTGYLVAWLIHIGEALYSLKLCREKCITDGFTQFLWFVQTFAFGIASLSYLLSYKPQKKKQ